MVRLGVALLIFIVPGILLYFLIRDEEDADSYLSGILPIGFAFSVCLIAVVGLTGRILGLPFVVVKYTFALVGLLDLIFLAFYKPNNVLDKQAVTDSLRNTMRNPPLILALILVTLMSFHDNLFFIDDTTYLAYLTNWQYSGQLGFKNIVHELDVIEYVRFWLAMYPMGQAVLADLSGLPGLLLLSHYLEPYLVLLAVITAYWFARVLGLSRKAAGFAVLIQITLYTWMLGDHFPVGMWFYQSMAEDKVTSAFILAPVFFVFGLEFIQRPSRKKLLLFFLMGIGLTLTHPVILFFSVCIIVCMGVLALLTKKTRWHEVLQLLVVVASVMLPYLVIRISEHRLETNISYDAASASRSFQIERYTRVVNDVFYGLNPDVLKFVEFDVTDNIADTVLQLFRLTPVVVALLAGVTALINLRKGPLYWYIFSCVLLITIAAVPYTGWLLGFFVSSRLISRSSWFSPLGMGAVLILKVVISWLKNQHLVERVNTIHLVKNFLRSATGLVACVVFISPILGYHFLTRVPAYFEDLAHNSQLAQVGTYIDENTNNLVMVIALDYWDTQLLPGVSAHARLISFREEKAYNGFNLSLAAEEINERIYVSNTIRSLEKDASDEERCANIKEYDVRFVVAQFDAVEIYEDKLSLCDIVFERVFETQNLILLEFQ